MMALGQRGLHGGAGFFLDASFGGSGTPCSLLSHDGGFFLFLWDDFAEISDGSSRLGNVGKRHRQTAGGDPIRSSKVGLGLG